METFCVTLRGKNKKEVLSDTGLDQEKGLETADKFNHRLEAAVDLTANEPDATVRLPETTHKKDARVHFDNEQGQLVLEGKSK